MRIVKDWNKGQWKFTLFHYQLKFSLKIEDGTTEQWYKFRDIEPENLDTLITIMSQDSISALIKENFDRLNKTMDIINAQLPESEHEEFDDIL